MFSIFYSLFYNTDHKWCFIGMKECYSFNIFHFIFYFFYYYLIQHRDRENQIYLFFNHDFPSYFLNYFLKKSLSL
ncbi:hypothetical protein DMI69_21465 [Escherichia coli]|nr:hypothetical protein [Escherichia coli]